MLRALLPFGARRTPFEQPVGPTAELPDTLLAATPAPLPTANADHPSTAPGEPALHTDPGDLPAPSTRPAYYAGAGLLLLALAAGWLLLRGRSDEDPPASRPAAAERAPAATPPLHAPATPGFAPGDGASTAAPSGPPAAGSTPPRGPIAPEPPDPPTAAPHTDAGAPPDPDAGTTPLAAADAATPPADTTPASPPATADAQRPDVRRRAPDGGDAADQDGVIRVRGYTAHTVYEN
jgi:hypothetical protein